MSEIFNMQSVSFEKVSQFLKERHEPDFRVKQWQQAFFKGKCLKFEDLTIFSEKLRADLIENFGERLHPVECATVESDEQACKYLLKMDDGARVECVYMKFHEGIKSLCISTQVGCPCACAFCATGGIGFKRNLTLDEILGQALYVAKTTEGIDRITVMGMGEALLNPNIFDALRCLTAPNMFGLSPQRISMSTVGNIEGIHAMTQKFPQVTLTFSLHFPEQSLREQWMPTAKKYALKDIFEALDEHVRVTKKKVYLAYMVIDGINNRPQDIAHLRQWIQERGDLAYLYHINLIPFHPIPNLNLAETPRATAIQLQKELERYGIEATVRQSFGKSIQGACGQLAAGYKKA
jgi:23S rRNA m2A2503 methyltransferase